MEKALVDIASDGHTLLDPSFDPFQPITAEQPAFRDWRDGELRGMMQHTVEAPDGTQHPLHSKTLSEARSPAGAGNA
eukprot:1786880-Prymnesium_polylepis.2